MHPDSRSTYAMHLLCIPFLSAFLLLSLSCSKGTDPDTSKPPDTGPVGILLSGTDTDPVLTGTRNHGPYVVPETEWDGDFVTTRLEAVINPNSTVGTANTALAAVGAKISCMRAGMMFTELVVPAQASEDQAKVVCSILVASGAFLSVYPCLDPMVGNDGAMIPDFPANMRITPFEEAKFPAAWNLRERAAGLHSPVTIVVSDDFTSFTPHPEIPSQTFIPGIGTVITSLNGQGLIDGNHGFAVAGTIGAKYDAIGSTGAFPDTANLLRLPCISLSNLGSWVAILTELYQRLPASGKFILNASWGYAGDFTRTSKRRRIEHAFYWRLLVAHRQSDFLVTQASGNDGFYSTAQTNADYNSPLTLTARFDTPRQMLQGTAVSPADTAALDTLFAKIASQGSVYAAKLRNVITVGSSDWSGGISTFSNGPADVRMIGENLTLPCTKADGICGPGPDVAWQGSYDGTSFAAPQVAALAGWLWALSPALTVDETKAIIMNSFYNNKWVDAYKATLSLDHSISNAGIRLSLLDVAGANGQKGSDMLFDEKDLQMFLDSILYYEADRGTYAPPWPTDHSCFDLNGNGYTGDTMLTPSTAPFDLDINTPPGYSIVHPPNCTDTSFDESLVTDRDILYYYAYSDLYTGKSNVRDSLVPCGSQVVALGALHNSYINIWAERVTSLNPYTRDTITNEQNSDGSTLASDPVSTHITLSAPCGGVVAVSDAKTELTWYVASGNIVTGVSASIECHEPDQTPSDPSCYAISGQSNADLAAQFVIRGEAVGFTATASTSVGAWGDIRVYLGGLSGPILELNANQNGSTSGNLLPGIYRVYITGSGSATTASITVTFAP